MKNVFLFASIVFASGLLFTNIYNSMIDVKSWGSDIPQSLETARQYFKAANPGNFFRVFSPINQILALLVVILFWKSSAQTRWYFLIAFLLYVLADIFTFAYFYPRNDILFIKPISDTDFLKKTWSEWNVMNWLRSLLLLIGLFFTFIAAHKIYIGKTSL